MTRFYQTRIYNQIHESWPTKLHIHLSLESKKYYFPLSEKTKLHSERGSKAPFAAGDDHLNKGATGSVKMPIPLLEANTSVPLLSLG